jgi:hypothetical protein
MKLHNFGLPQQRTVECSHVALGYLTGHERVNSLSVSVSSLLCEYYNILIWI